MTNKKKVVLLGATGSIGENTLQVLRAHKDRLELVGIAAQKNTGKLAEIAHEFSVKHVSVFDEKAYAAAKTSGLFPQGTVFHCGLEGLKTVSMLPSADIVLAAIVGTVSLEAIMAAIDAGKDIALASKEILVLGGKFVMQHAKEKGVNILPTDSEHNAIFQCLQGAQNKDFAKIWLTASGGIFRNKPLAELRHVTPEMATCHPNWKMGPKITVDSATMANKGLELIEARWLFDASPVQLDVVIHPQSIVHSMVQFVDGSFLAQLSPPSMTFPIRHCLFYPERVCNDDPVLNFSNLLSLEFVEPDYKRFPCLQLALECLNKGGTAPAVFNSANDVAVASFLRREIAFTDIASVIEKTLNAFNHCEPDSLEQLMETDREAHLLAKRFL